MWLFLLACQMFYYGDDEVAQVEMTPVVSGWNVAVVLHILRVTVRNIDCRIAFSSATMAIPRHPRQILGHHRGIQCTSLCLLFLRFPRGGERASKRET